MSNYRNEDLVRFSRMFGALSNMNRMRIFMRLVSCCPPGDLSCTGDEFSTCIGELGKDLDIAPSTISHHVKELTRAGIIRVERHGKTVRCSLDNEVLKKLELFFRSPVTAEP